MPYTNTKGGSYNLVIARVDKTDLYHIWYGVYHIWYESNFVNLLIDKKMVVTRIKPLYDEKGKIRGYIDKYTEEIYGFPVIIGRKKNPYGKGWVMNSQDAALIIAKDKDIKGETHRVLWFIIGILDFENWVQISITEIAKELNIKQPHVSRAIKVLEEKEVILRGPKIGRSYAFMLNPNFGWKGNVENLEEYRNKKHKEEIKNSNKKENLVQLSKKYNMSIQELLRLREQLI